MLNPQSPAPMASDHKGAKPALTSIAVPHFRKLPDQLDQRINILETSSDNITLKEAEMLMATVQTGQRNLTEAQNKMSKYRKAVASILERQRREAAKARRTGSESTTMIVDADVNPVALGDTEDQGNQ